MLCFADVFGYVFRRDVAKAIHLDAAQYMKADGYPSVADDIAHQRWTGEGHFSAWLKRCPFEVVVWLCTTEGRKLKIRNTMDISNHHSEIWHLGSIVDIWLKTPLLTFNRAFPDEINVFEPRLCTVEELHDHWRLVEMVTLGPQFERAYIEGLAAGDQGAGERLMALAKRA